MQPSGTGALRRHHLAKCESCSLNNDKSIFVPSSKPSSGVTKLVIVGEAPGAQEARRGKPFTGPSGKLLDSVLRGHGLRREDTFITNACLCRPRDNATPSGGDVAACAPRLEAELREACSTGSPILTLGNIAASAVFGQKVAITNFRVGPAKESPKYPGIRVVPTVHPAYVLRTSDAFPIFADDIGKVNERIDIRWEAPTFRVFDEAPTALEALRQLRDRAGDVVVDIEIGSEKDTQFVHPDQYQLLCVGFSYAPGRAIVIGETALHSGRRDGLSSVRHMLSQVLENRRARIIAHNGKFDLAGLEHIAPKAVLGFDTMLASYAVDERPGTHGLKYLAQERLGAPKYDLEIHKYLDKAKNFAHIPREILYKYNAYDVTCTFDLKDYYVKKMSKDETQVHNMLVRASNMLMPAEMKGLTVDTAYLDTVSERYLQRLAELEGELKPWVMNPRSPLQVKAALEAMGLTVNSTAVDVLTVALRHPRLSDECRKFIDLLLKHRREAKLYGTYVKGIRQRLYKGRVHSTFLLHGTTTGRLASRNPNLQNVPRDDPIGRPGEPSMRRMFIPSPGKVFVQADYKGAELRVVCCEAEDTYLRDLFNEGRDIHSEVAARFFGPNFTKDQRVRAKAVVFGLAYGREEYSLAQEYNLPVHEAKKYLDTFFEMIPDTVRWRDNIKDQILYGEEDLRTHFGRHRRIWLVTDDNMKDVVKEGLAFIPQSTASDICLHAAMELHEVHNLDIRLLVHDSILVECDPADAGDVGALMKRVMSQVAKDVYSDYVPFEADVSAGSSWGEL